MKGIIGKKLGMTQMFDEEGRAVPVTVILAEPNRVVQVKTPERDGYEAVKLGFEVVPGHKLTKAERTIFTKLGVEPMRHLREFRLAGATEMTPGALHRVEDAFQPGDLVDVIGTSKGKGFASGIKRWGFRRGPMSHGSKYHRRVGSLGPRMSGGGGRVRPGRKMPGHMGHRRVTVLNLRVMRVDPERNLLLVRGAVPGPRHSLVMVREAVKKRKTGGGR